MCIVMVMISIMHILGNQGRVYINPPLSPLPSSLQVLCACLLAFLKDIQPEHDLKCLPAVSRQSILDQEDTMCGRANLKRVVMVIVIVLQILSIMPILGTKNEYINPLLSSFLFSTATSFLPFPS